MITQAELTRVEPRPLLDPVERSAPARPSHWRRLRAWTRAHRGGLVLLGLVLVVAGVAHAWGMHSSPAPSDDEGTYMAQAWAVQRRGDLAHYTYWYDHPPLGWILIAGWTWVTGAFE